MNEEVKDELVKSEIVLNSKQSDFNVKLPKNVGNLTLQEIMNQEGTYFEKKGNKLTASMSYENYIVSMSCTKFDDGEIFQQAIHNKKKSKKENKKKIKEMSKDGMSQKEIANQLGMSQPYVSKLLKEKE